MKEIDEKTIEQLADVVVEKTGTKIKEEVATQMVDLEKKFDEKFESLKSTAPTVEAKDLDGQGEDKDALDKVSRMAKFLRGVVAEDKEAIKESYGTKAMSLSTGAAGGFLVPEELQADIWRIEELYGLVRSQARIIPMRREKISLNRIGSDVTAYWTGYGTSGTESSPTVERLDIPAQTLTGITMFENELMEDSDVGIVNTLTSLFAQAMSGEEDDQAFNGDGDPFVGIFNDADVTAVTSSTGYASFSAINMDYLHQLISTIKPKALRRAAFYMSPYLWHIIQITKQNSQYITTFANPILTKGAWTPEQAADMAGTLWGYPVFLSEKLPDSSDSGASVECIIFGNMDYFVVGDRREMDAKMFDAGTVSSTSLIETNQSAIRVTRRVAMGVGIPEAFAVYKTSAT